MAVASWWRHNCYGSNTYVTDDVVLSCAMLDIYDCGNGMKQRSRGDLLVLLKEAMAESEEKKREGLGKRWGRDLVERIGCGGRFCGKARDDEGCQKQRKKEE